MRSSQDGKRQWEQTSFYADFCCKEMSTNPFLFSWTGEWIAWGFSVINNNWLSHLGRDILQWLPKTVHPSSWENARLSVIFVLRPQIYLGWVSFNGFMAMRLLCTCPQAQAWHKRPNSTLVLSLSSSPGETGQRKIKWEERCIWKY